MKVMVQVRAAPKMIDHILQHRLAISTHQQRLYMTYNILDSCSKVASAEGLLTLIILSHTMCVQRLVHRLGGNGLHALHAM